MSEPPPAAGPPPTLPLAPGNHDKAWNDPPLFSISSAGAGAGRLTRRVAFPTSGPTAPGHDPTAPPGLHDAGAKPPPCNLAPPPPCLPPIAAPAPSTVSTPDEIIADDPDLADKQLQRLLADHLPGRRTELTGRLGGVWSDWRAGRLPSRTASLLAGLLHCLAGGEAARAEQQLLVLSADYTAVVGGPALLALRHLVTAVQGSSAATVPASAFLPVTQPL